MFDGSWSPLPATIPICQPITCSAPPLTPPPSSMNWNVTYKVFIQDSPTLATTSLIYNCQKDFHFVDQVGNLTVTCGFDR